MFRWNRRTILIVAIALVGLFTINFAVRTVQHARRFHARADEPIQSWMNIPYIAHSYHVPPQVIADALGIPPGTRDPRPLREIAATQGRSVDELVSDIMAAINRFRPPPPPQPDAAPSVAAPESQP